VCPTAKKHGLAFRLNNQNGEGRKMANKVWGTLIIVMGVASVIWGVMEGYHTYEAISDAKNMSAMLGGSLDKMIEQNAPSYVPAIVALVVGVVASVVGTKMLNKAA
jgi:choline-glycine betaine transporter